MNQYFDGINYTLLVITMFVALLLIFQSYVLWQTHKENEQLRKDNALLNRHPASVSTGPTKLLDYIDHEVAEELRIQWINENPRLVQHWQIDQPTLFDLHIDDALKLANS